MTESRTHPISDLTQAVLIAVSNPTQNGEEEGHPLLLRTTGESLYAIL